MTNRKKEAGETVGRRCSSQLSVTLRASAVRRVMERSERAEELGLTLLGDLAVMSAGGEGLTILIVALAWPCGYLLTDMDAGARKVVQHKSVMTLLDGKNYRV